MRFIFRVFSFIARAEGECNKLKNEKNKSILHLHPCDNRFIAWKKHDKNTFFIMYLKYKTQVNETFYK